MDPPEHSRLRRLVGQAFTVRRVESLRPKVHEIVHGLIDEMTEQGPPADLTEFAVALPLSVIELLLRRLPGLALAVDDQDLVWNKGLFLRGLKALPVTWTAG